MFKLLLKDVSKRGRRQIELEGRHTNELNTLHKTMLLYMVCTSPGEVRQGK